MDDIQNLTKPISETPITDTKSVDRKVPDWRHDAWIDYRALNGTIIEYNEEAGGETVSKLKMDDLAAKLGVTRQTLYDWEKSIPDFWEKVRARKRDFASQRRLSLMEDKFYIHAMTWKNPKISLAWLEQNSPDWRDPKQKHEMDVGDNMAALLRRMEDAKQAEPKTIIDARVVTND